MRKSTKFVALDIHKDSITVALAELGDLTRFESIPTMIERWLNRNRR